MSSYNYFSWSTTSPSLTTGPVSATSLRYSLVSCKSYPSVQLHTYSHVGNSSLTGMISTYHQNALLEDGCDLTNCLHYNSSALS